MIIQGDCIEQMKLLEESSVDAIVTDPPYGIGFMGKEWDNFKPSTIKEGMEKDKRPKTQIASTRTSNIAGTYDLSLNGNTKFMLWWKEVATQCLRILKPGGFLLSFGGTRTYHRLVCGIEDAGFEIRDTIMWLYGSGFPKSLNIGKQIDKMGSGKFIEFGNMITEYRNKKGLSMRDIAKHFPSRTGGLTGCVWNWEKGNNVPTLEQYNKLIEILGIPLDKAKEFERDIIGTAITNKTVYQKIGERNTSGEIDITKGNSEWEGWGTALKPAVEPIVVARKPLSEKNVALNVLKWGTGGINIDACRIEHNDIKRGGFGNAPIGFGGGSGKGVEWKQDTQGRFPANIILDEEAGNMLDEQSGELSVTGKRSKESQEKFDFASPLPLSGKTNKKNTEYPNDKGGASRFFYCAKASKSERNLGCDDLKEKHNPHGSYVGRDLSNPKVHLGGLQGGISKNNHPTVKPIKLMEYLIKLVSKEGATVLDPFLGSGTTAIACLKLDRKFIGIEKEEEYIKIAKARLKPFQEQRKLK